MQFDIGNERISTVSVPVPPGACIQWEALVRKAGGPTWRQGDEISVCKLASTKTYARHITCATRSPTLRIKCIAPQCTIIVSTGYTGTRLEVANLVQSTCSRDDLRTRLGALTGIDLPAMPAPLYSYTAFAPSKLDFAAVDLSTPDLHCSEAQEAGGVTSLYLRSGTSRAVIFHEGLINLEVFESRAAAEACLRCVEAILAPAISADRPACVSIATIMAAANTRAKNRRRIANQATVKAHERQQAHMAATHARRKRKLDELESAEASELYPTLPIGRRQGRHDRALERARRFVQNDARDRISADFRHSQLIAPPQYHTHAHVFDLGQGQMVCQE